MKKKKEKLANVTTCDYGSFIDMKTTARTTEGEPLMESSVLREMLPTGTVRTVVSVRTAKAHLSGLLEQVAGGQEITITSDGVPKARLVPISAKKQRPFLGTRAHLATMPPWQGGLTSEEIIREDRDSRG
jgi:prevent-host-death family protein